jgi:hypothetical protein
MQKVTENGRIPPGVLKKSCKSLKNKVPEVHFTKPKGVIQG